MLANPAKIAFIFDYFSFNLSLHLLQLQSLEDILLLILYKDIYHLINGLNILSSNIEIITVINTTVRPVVAKEIIIKDTKFIS